MHAVELAASVVAPMWQAQSQHTEVFELGNELHVKALQQAEDQHLEGQRFEHILHKHSLQLEKELHYEQMSHDLDIAKREATRDVWSQRNQLIQTLMVVDTLMFSCAFAITVQGDPPANTATWLIRLYSISLGTSLAFLFVSIWLSLKLQTRMSHYDMHRPKIVYNCGSTHLHFNDYYRCHCKRLSKLAFFCYYVGTAATICDGAIFAVAKLYWEYSNLAAAIIFIIIAFFAMILPAVGRLIWPGSTSSNTSTVYKDQSGSGGGDGTNSRRRRKTTEESGTTSVTHPDIVGERRGSSNSGVAFALRATPTARRAGDPLSGDNEIGDRVDDGGSHHLSSSFPSSSSASFSSGRGHLLIQEDDDVAGLGIEAQEQVIRADESGDLPSPLSPTEMVSMEQVDYSSVGNLHYRPASS